GVVAPVADGRLDEGLVRVGGGGLELRAAHHDAVVGLADNAQQHVGVLLTRVPATVSLGVGVGRDVEGVEQRGAAYVVADVGREARVDLVEHVLAVVEGPHLADGLVTDAGDHAAHVVEDGLDGRVLGVPVLLDHRRLAADGAGLAGLVVDISHGRGGPGLVRQVVDPRSHVDDRLERRVGGDVLDLLAVDPHLAAVRQGFLVLLTGPDHDASFTLVVVTGCSWSPRDRRDLGPLLQGMQVSPAQAGLYQPGRVQAGVPGTMASWPRTMMISRRCATGVPASWPGTGRSRPATCWRPSPPTPPSTATATGGWWPSWRGRSPRCSASPPPCSCPAARWPSRRCCACTPTGAAGARWSSTPCATWTGTRARPTSGCTS